MTNIDKNNPLTNINDSAQPEDGNNIPPTGRTRTQKVKETNSETLYTRESASSATKKKNQPTHANSSEKLETINTKSILERSESSKVKSVDVETLYQHEDNFDSKSASEVPQDKLQKSYTEKISPNYFLSDEENSNSNISLSEPLNSKSYDSVNHATSLNKKKIFEPSEPSTPEATVDKSSDSKADTTSISELDKTNTNKLDKIKQQESIFAETYKSLPCYKKLAKAYVQTLFDLYQTFYGERNGVIKFCGDALPEEKSKSGGTIPKYAAPNHPGWNPASIVKTIKNGTGDQLNTIALYVINKPNFSSIVGKILGNPHEPRNEKIISDFFSPETLSSLQERYQKDPENFVIFEWSGWLANRDSTRTFLDAEHLPDHDIKQLYEKGHIKPNEMNFLLTNPKYGLDIKLDGQGSYDIDKTLENTGTLMGKLDLGKDRIKLTEDSVFLREVERKGSYAIAGPSGSAMRFFKIGQLFAPALRKQLNNISNEQLMELNVPHCVAYLVPHDHSVIEVEMPAQDFGFLDTNQTLENGRKLFTQDIQYGANQDERINQTTFNEMLDKNNKK